jgi:Phage tail lysozyme
MTAKAQESYDFWRSQGFNRQQALGFVGNEQGEGTMGSDSPALHWDGSHYSGGIVQWDPTRRAAIAKALGIDVWHDRNHLHQLQAEAWELRKRYPQLWAALKNAKTIGQVTAGLVRHYELPADQVHSPAFALVMASRGARGLVRAGGPLA